MPSRALYNLLRKTSKDDLLKMSLRYCKHGHNMLAHPKCFLEGVRERIGFLDIETSSLEANFGQMLSWCIKDSETGEILFDVVTKEEIFGGASDYRLVQSIIDCMKTYDRLVTWYGARFDIPFIRSRALLHNLDFPKYKQLVHTDAYDIARRKLKIHSNRLESVCELMDIPAKGHRLTPKLLCAARIGQQEALADVLEHNREDVISLELAYNRLCEFTHANKTSI